MPVVRGVPGQRGGVGWVGAWSAGCLVRVGAHKFAELTEFPFQCITSNIDSLDQPLNSILLNTFSRGYKKADKLEITQEDIEEKVTKAVSDVRNIQNCFTI